MSKLFPMLSTNAPGGDQAKDGGFRVEEVLKELKLAFSLERFGYDILDSKTELRDRFIETDKFHINLGHAMDSIHDNRVQSEATMEVLEISPSSNMRQQ